MSNKGITADEARKNSQSSAFGADEVLEQTRNPNPSKL